MKSHCFLWEIAAQHLAITWRLPFHQLFIPVSCTTKRHVPQHLFLSFYICRPGCAFCHPLIRIPFLPLCTPPNLFLPSCDGGNLIIVKSLECLLEVQFPVFVHTAVRHLLPLWLFPSFTLQWPHGTALPVLLHRDAFNSCQQNSSQAPLARTLPHPQMVCCVDAVLCHSSLGSMCLPFVSHSCLTCWVLVSARSVSAQ